MPRFAATLLQGTLGGGAQSADAAAAITPPTSPSASSSLLSGLDAFSLSAQHVVRRSRGCCAAFLSSSPHGGAVRSLPGGERARGSFGDFLVSDARHDVERAPGAGWPTAFASEAPKNLKKHPKEFIANVNASALKNFQAIQTALAKVGSLRDSLDYGMEGPTKSMEEPCADYMRHRAEIYALAGTHCAAAQGRVNAAQISERGGFDGCYVPPAAGEPGGDEGGAMPAYLRTKYCSHGDREILCARRLRDLMRSLPAPGEANDADSMDAQVREWCHPMLIGNTPHVSVDLASGMPEAEE
eukprot:TRINITY_DN73743_c0_g1_i1.p1 TRINITY_DN73743_c0_g1~~TRINITY_DN73743_c0_g1_i1.p1  ORF type:complete len:299 (+),score=56.79 TRINITY_DN73743_c0_g1_i1:130-1026(+)